MDTDATFPHQMFELVIRAYLNVQIAHHDGNIIFRKSLLDCIHLVIESLLLLCNGSVCWCIVLHY